MSRSLEVIDFDTNRKHICDFILMYNTSLYRIAYPCQVIAQYWLNYRLRQGQGPAGMFLVNALVLGNLCNSP